MSEEKIEVMRVLKTANCPSLSGKSTLTYQLSCSTDKSVYVSITGNSGGGLFSKKPVALAEITPLLNADQITSGTLHPAFKGSSANTAGFILAVLLNEGVIKLISEPPRKYKLDDLPGFNARIQALVNSGTPTADQKKPAKAKKKVYSESPQEG